MFRGSFALPFILDRASIFLLGKVIFIEQGGRR